ncbi:hypothetical protein FQN50_001856 [Emmonsiellopsis sp. PD_5]|nr:hypothetical protein FQN50_001856 [Emmonsiellopsis sp. PD_5]
MRLSQSISWPLLLALAGTVAARGPLSEPPTTTIQQTATDPRTHTTTPTPVIKQELNDPAPATITVEVSPNQHLHNFWPRNVNANPGDTIVFKFFKANHSVAQAEYDAPCVPAAGKIPFFSGIRDTFEKDEDGIDIPQYWSLLINDTQPLYYYCSGKGSCIDFGMVGVINSNESVWKTQRDKAEFDMPYQYSPGEEPPTEGELAGGGAGSGSDSDKPQNHGLSGGAIAGIVIGAVAGVGILGALFYLFGRNQVYRQWLTSEDGHNDRTRKWALSGGWSSGPKSEAGPVSEIGAGTVTSHPGHMSYMNPEFTPNPSHMSYNQSPPAQWGWDQGAAAAAAGMHSPKMGYVAPPPAAPQELSSEQPATQLVELDAGQASVPASPPVSPPVSPPLRPDQSQS